MSPYLATPLLLGSNILMIMMTFEANNRIGVAIHGDMRRPSVAMLGYD